MKQIKIQIQTHFLCQNHFFFFSFSLLIELRWKWKIKIQIQIFHFGNPFLVNSNPIHLSSLSVTSNENFLSNRFFFLFHSNSFVFCAILFLAFILKCESLLIHLIWKGCVRIGINTREGTAWGLDTRGWKVLILLHILNSNSIWPYILD